MSDTMTTAADGEPRPGVEHDIMELDAYTKWTRNWHERGRNIIRRYCDDRAQVTAMTAGQRRFNILWSNVQVLQPALYARRPSPVVERRFKDEDPIGRVAAEVLERAVTFTVDTDLFDRVMRQCRDDRLLPGRGTAWLRYDAEIGQDGLIATESVNIDYVDWEDFGHNPARVWADVYLIWRRVQMTRAELEERFLEVGAEIPLDARAPKEGDDRINALRDEVFSRAEIYEIWDKRTREVRWVSRSWPKALDVKEDPLGLKHFFPCPRPLYATLVNESLIPTPDFSLYQDQARELDDLNTRLARLVEACKVVGVYDGSVDAGLQRMLTEGTENKLIPIANWGSFAAAGGMDGSMQFMPLDGIAKAIPVLTDRFEVVKQEVYEITGIADIVRGASEANETATAQQIKGRYAALRLNDMQADVARFARDLIAMTAEIIAEHFSQKSIFEMAQKALPTDAEVEQQQLAYQMQVAPLVAQHRQMVVQAQATGQEPPPEPQLPPPPPKPDATQEQVVALLRNDAMRTYKIEIETDSTIAVDQEAQKASTNEFIGAMTAFFEKALPMAVAAPELLPLFKEVSLEAARNYRTGRALEATITTTFDALEAKAAQAMANPQPNPAQMEAEAKIEAIKATSQATIAAGQAKTEAEIRALAMKTEAEIKAKEMTVQADLMAKQATTQADMADKRARTEMDLETGAARAEGQMEIDRMKAKNAGKGARPQ